jgi:RNA polymerase sigma-70 factor (ECF subfamily)
MVRATGPGLNWEELSRRCRREARSRTTDRVAADDVAQEALLRAWRAWSRGVRPDCPEAWLVTITRREVARWDAGPSARSWRSARDEIELDDPGRDDPDAIVERAHVRGVLETLQPEDRLLVRLRYEEDLTQAEVARRLGTPEGTAKVRLHRLRARLRERLSS